MLVPLDLNELNVLCYALNSMVKTEGLPNAQHAVPMWQKLMEMRKNLTEIATAPAPAPAPDAPAATSV